MKNSYIGLMVGDSSGLLIGLLGILKSGNCLVPINPAFPDDRVGIILEDCRITVLLTDKNYYAKARSIAEISSCLEHVICIDDIDFEGAMQQARKMSRVAIDDSQPRQPVYVIYTSGSTGKPKGVQITHDNLLPLLSWFIDYFKLGEHTRVLQNLSYTFDFGIFELLTTVLVGGVLYFFNKQVLSDLNEYVDFIHRHQLDTIHTTPSFFANIITLGRPLSPLKLIHLGGERLTRQMVHESARYAAKDCYIYNGYGPTETTINSAIFSFHVEEGRPPYAPENIPIGKPSANNLIYILDAYGNLQPVGVIGELYIGGGGVAPGYVNRPELTAEKFIQGGSFRENHPPAPPAKAFDKSFLGVQGAILQKSPLCQKLYKTGDLGRWLPDGNIEFLGRIDLQVKIRGFRIELGEIENRLLTHKMIKEVVVIDREDASGEKYLCAYITTRSKQRTAALNESLTAAELHEYLSGSLPEYMIPSYFIEIEKIPLNPSGKVNRRELPIPRIVEKSVSYTAPRNDVEERISAIWAQVLGISKEKIGIDDNFFHIGGHSLKGTVVISKFHKEFEVKIVLADLFKTPTIRGLSTYIEQSVQEKYRPIDAVEKKEYYVLSSAQKRLFIMMQLEYESTSYNIPMAYRLKTDEKPDLNKWQEIFKKLIRRHESFRTSFIMLEDEPVQRIYTPQDVFFEIKYVAAEHNRPGPAPVSPGHEVFPWLQDLVEGFIRPFDLAKAPLLRVWWVNTGEAYPFLIVDMHHIISDGISIQLFQEELIALYNLEDISPIRVQYKDFSQWQKKENRKEKIKKQEEYWLQEFVGEIPKLELPLDYTRPTVQNFAGDLLTFTLDKEQTRSLNRMAQEMNVTLFMFLFSVFNIFLSKLSGQDDIVIGTPTAGRRHSDLDKIIGMFINTLALRNQLAGENTFVEFLTRIRGKTLLAFENQEYQFDDLVDNLFKIRDTGRNPLFDTMFVVQNMQRERLETPGIGLLPYDINLRVSKFDMTLYVLEEGEKLLLIFEYCTKLFKKATIEQFPCYFKEILSIVLENREVKLGQIKISHDLFDQQLDNPTIDFSF